MLRKHTNKNNQDNFHAIYLIKWFMLKFDRRWKTRAA